MGETPRIIGPFVGEKLNAALELVRMAQETKSPDMLKQHLAGAELMIEFLLGQVPLEEG